MSSLIGLVHPIESKRERDVGWLKNRYIRYVERKKERKKARIDEMTNNDHATQWTAKGARQNSTFSGSGAIGRPFVSISTPVTFDPTPHPPIGTPTGVTTVLSSPVTAWHF